MENDLTLADLPEALDGGEQLLKMAEFTVARELFQAVIAIAEVPGHVQRARLGAAKASSRLFDIDGMLTALQAEMADPFEDWPDKPAAEANLLAASVWNFKGQADLTLDFLRQATRSILRAAGHPDPKADPAMCVGLAANSPDRELVEVLVSACLSLSEFFAFRDEPRLSIEWLKAAIAGAGRFLGGKFASLMRRIQFVISTHQTLSSLTSDAADAIEESFEFGDDAQRAVQAWRDVDFSQLDAGDIQKSIEVYRDTDLSQLDVGDPAEGLLAINPGEFTEEFISSGDAELVCEGLVLYIEELDSLEWHRLAALARMQLARCLLTIDVKQRASAKPFERKKTVVTEISDQPVVRDLLLSAIHYLSSSWYKEDPYLRICLGHLATYEAGTGNLSAAERICRLGLASVAPLFGIAIGVPDILAVTASIRGAKAAETFWAKIGLLAICEYSNFRTAFSQHSLGKNVVQSDHVRVLTNLLSEQGRLGEINEIIAVIEQARSSDELPFSRAERDALEAIKTQLPEKFSPPMSLGNILDLDNFFDDIEYALEAERNELHVPNISDYELPKNSAVIAAQVQPDGVSIQLLSSQAKWSGFNATDCEPEYPFSKHVWGIVGSMSSPPSRDDAADSWNNIFAAAELNAISAAVLDGVPQFKAHTLAVAASGALRFMPFALLGEAQPIVEILPTITLPRVQLASREWDGSSLKVAAVAPETDTFDTATDETDRLELLLPQDRFVRRIADRADRSEFLRLLESDAKVLHFAGHCVADSADPGSSKLLLGRGTSITLAEIAERDLSHLELITLAACASGLPGGVLLQSPADLLHAAGAHRVLNTLWPVHHRITSKLMVEFYNFLFGSRKMKPAEALRQAQLVIRARHPHPYYWAAFQLSGYPDL